MRLRRRCLLSASPITDLSTGKTGTCVCVRSRAYSRFRIPGVDVLIASLLIERSAAGPSVRELVESIRSEVASDAGLVLHVDTVVALTLGTAWRAAMDERFDGKAAGANLAFFRPRVIPRPPGTMPPGVTEVRFVADLSSCPSVPLDDQENRPVLLAAAIRRRSRSPGRISPPAKPPL